MAIVDWDRWLSLFENVASKDLLNERSIVLNRRQNRYLARTCFSKLKEIRAMNIPLECNDLVKELEEIEAYLKNCSEKFWWEYFVTKLNTDEGYSIFLHDFMWYTATLDAVLQHSSGRSFVREISRSIVECDKCLSRLDLSDDVRADRDAVVELLCSMRRRRRLVKCIGRMFVKPQPQGNKHHIASFLSERLNADVCLQAVTEQALPQKFWIDPKDICRPSSRPIGEGSSGSVFEGRWLGQRVAVKEFKTDDPSFIKEAAMLAALSNPYIVQLIGWSKDQGENVYSLVMELMSEDLASYMETSMSSIETPMLTKFAVDIMLQISRGMEYLHKMKVIHRDLKLQNVLVKPCSCKAGYVRIKLTDFGVANFKPDTPFFSTEKQGTAYYRAPEVFRFADLSEGADIDVVSKKYTRKADVFSFAILCYEILAQESPPCFFNISAQDVYKKVIANVRPDLPVSCPRVLSDCIKRCWDSDPHRRPSFAEISKVLRYVKSVLIAIKSVPAAKSSVTLRELLEQELPEEISQIDEGREMEECSERDVT